MTDEADRGRVRVLLVEDERPLAELYTSWLTEVYEVETVHDGEAAIDAYDERVDVALLDRRLPETSGDRVLEHIRESGNPCRVAMVSAVTPDFDIYGMGFDDYLVKPISKDDLLGLVEQLVRVSDYDEGLRRHFALSSKLALLQTHKTEAELAESEEYAALRAEMDELDRELTEAVGEMSISDVGAVLRDA